METLPVWNKCRKSLHQSLIFAMNSSPNLLVVLMRPIAGVHIRTVRALPWGIRPKVC